VYVRFLVESVLDLKQQLKLHGSDLLIKFGRPETVVTEMVQSIRRERNEVVGVWMQKEVTSEEGLFDSLQGDSTTHRSLL